MHSGWVYEMDLGSLFVAFTTDERTMFLRRIPAPLDPKEELRFSRRATPVSASKLRSSGGFSPSPGIAALFLADAQLKGHARWAGVLERWGDVSLAA